LPRGKFAKYGLGAAVVNDFCVVPAGMVGVPLAGAPTVSYRLLSRAGLASDGTQALRALIVETVRRG